MIDTNTTDLETVLLQRGDPVAEKYVCDYVDPDAGPARCGYIGPAFSFADVRQFEGVEGHAFICGNCYQGFLRRAKFIAAAFGAAFADAPGWKTVDPATGAEIDTEEGYALKSWRNTEIASVLWAIQPASPLTQACQDAFTAYISGLHRMTVDYAGPRDYVKPPRPELVYAEA